MMIIRKFLLTLFDTEWKRFYFAAIAPECTREGQIMENLVNVHLTVSVCRPERQAQLMRKAIQIIPEIPQLLLKQFGVENLKQVLDPCILDCVSADGSLPEGIIPPISPFNITLDLEEMDEPTTVLPTEVDSAFKSTAESMGDLSALTNKSKGKSVNSTRSSATGATTESTRGKLKEEIHRNDFMLKVSQRMQAQQNIVAAYNYDLRVIMEAKGEPDAEKFTQINNIIRELDRLNTVIREMNDRLDPDYTRGPHDMDLSEYGILWPATPENEEPPNSDEPVNPSNQEDNEGVDLSGDDESMNSKLATPDETKKMDEEQEDSPYTKKWDEMEEDAEFGEYQPGDLSDTDSPPPSPTGPPAEYLSQFPDLKGTQSPTSESKQTAVALNQLRMKKKLADETVGSKPSPQPPDNVTDPLSASPNAGEGRE